MARIEQITKEINGVETEIYPVTIHQSVVDESNNETLDVTLGKKAEHGYSEGETPKTLKEIEVGKANQTDLAQLAGDVSKKSKYPYEDGFPFSQIVINRGVDNFLIDAYFDFDYEDGYRYSFSTIDATSGTLKASMFKHPEGLPPSGNIVLVAQYTFTKEANNKYYTGKSSARPNDWVIANLDIIQPDEVWHSMYYTDGVGLSPRLFKSVSQKKVTEEINTINSKLVPFDFDPDILTISNAKISDISYIHPNGMVEYEGNVSNYPQPAVGTYLAPQGKKLLVRRIKFGIYIPPTAVGMVKVYKGLTLSADPSAHTLVEEINVTDRAAVDQLQEIVLSEDLILQGNEYLYVYFVCESTDLPYPRIRRWNISGEARPSMLFSLGLATWHIGGSAYYTTPLLTYSSASGVADITELSAQVLDHEERIEVIESFIPENSLIDISLPDTIYAIVGDTLQLFYRGMIAHPYPYIYNIVVNCSKGKQYPRYFEYLPTIDDIGTATFNVEVRDRKGKLLGGKTCSLVTKEVVGSPASPINVLNVGDSLTSAGTWCIEASRRLIGSGGTPAGLGLTNISFLGRKTGSGIGWEGTGGWTWSQYAFAGVPAYKFYVSGVMTAPSIGATYTNNGITYTISEVNITSGTGYVSATGTGAPTASGSLTKLSGGGDVALEFSSSEADAGNPFWESDTNSLDFPQYVNTYMNGSCDVIYFLLSWNGQSPNRTDFSSMTTYAKVLIDHIHTEYPNCKMKIMGVQVPSLNGGMGANYGADGTGLSDTYGMVVTALNMNKAYQDWCNEPAYSSFLEFVNISSQFDSENNMPESDVPVNSRSSKTEKIGTNGVHPATAGYYQIADVVFRNFVANFCQ